MPLGSALIEQQVVTNSVSLLCETVNDRAAEVTGVGKWITGIDHSDAIYPGLGNRNTRPNGRAD